MYRLITTSSYSKIKWASALIVLAKDIGSFVEEQLHDCLTAPICRSLESVAIRSALSVELGLVLQEGIGYAGKLEDFTIKPLQQESLLLIGECHHLSSHLSPGRPPTRPRHASARTTNNDAAQIQLSYSRAGQGIVVRQNTTGISDDNGCRSEDDQHRTRMRKNNRSDEIEEQRLRVYKEEGKA
jgi:hypothetical protein